MPPSLWWLLFYIFASATRLSMKRMININTKSCCCAQLCGPNLMKPKPPESRRRKSLATVRRNPKLRLSLFFPTFPQHPDTALSSHKRPLIIYIFESQFQVLHASSPFLAHKPNYIPLSSPPRLSPPGVGRWQEGFD